MKMSNWAVFRDCNVLPSCTAGPRGHLGNEGRHLRGWPTSHFPTHGKGERSVSDTPLKIKSFIPDG